MWTSFKRIARAGFVSFWRNGFLSLASILALTIALSFGATLLLFNIIATTYLGQIKDKVDINIYFTEDAKEDDIMALKKIVETLPEVSRTEYISKELVLESFKKRNENNAHIMQGLEEIGKNPFSAVLNIKAKEPQQYGGISKFLESKSALSADGGAIIESVNYNRNKDIINRLARIISVTEKVSIAISILLALAVVVITLNTVRLIIYSARDEISVMKLVGASNMHVRGPFVVSGVMCGAISAIITTLIMVPATYYFGLILKQITPDFSLQAYYLVHIGEIFVILLIAGVFLGGISSFISVKRYLNI